MAGTPRSATSTSGGREAHAIGSFRVGFVAAAVGPALACLVTNPADVARTRLALDAALQPSSSKTYSGAMDCIWQAWQAEGIVGVQRGLGFAMIREASKNSFRIGLYDPIIAQLTGGKRPASWGERLAAGGASGGVAAIVCNPLDRLKTLLQLAGRPTAGAAEATSSRGLAGTFARDNGAPTHVTGAARAPPTPNLCEIVRGIIQREGMRGLWRGASVNVARSVIGTAVQLSTNSRLQEVAAAAHLPKGAASDALCALTASVLLVLTISPTDVVRARIYSQPSAPDGTGLLYRGPWHCAQRVVATEGPAGLFKGVVASWLRVGPHTTLSLVLVSAIKRAADG